MRLPGVCAITMQIWINPESIKPHAAQHHADITDRYNISTRGRVKLAHFNVARLILPSSTVGLIVFEDESSVAIDPRRLSLCNRRLVNGSI